MITRGSGEFEATVMVDDDEFDVLVKYRGYSDTGKLNPVDEAYPPEGEVELDIVGLPPGITLSDKEQERLEDLAYEHLHEDTRY